MIVSWAPVADDSPFPLENLPYGVVERAGEPHVAVAIGDAVLDLHAAAIRGLLDGAVDLEAARAQTLNPLLERDPAVWRALRERVVALLTGEPPPDAQALLLPRESAVMRLPFVPGDYVDFYSSIEHATNLGKILRPDGDPLLPNWRWIPIGYHGRSSTIVLDGTPIARPCGQRKAPHDAAPAFGPSRSLDIELEVGFVTGRANRMGERLRPDAAAEQIFGLVLVNDWSARDIQAWEYQPLGPFLGKSFATSISPWVVPLEALEPYRVAGPRQEPPPLEYLRCERDWNYDIELRVELQSAKMREEERPPYVISRSNYRWMYWNMAQQLAHVTSNGTAVRAGDLYASGTISGAEPQSYGSLIELTWRGARPIELPGGEQRAFLEDGDTIAITGVAAAPGKPRIGFGSVRGTIQPAAL